MTLVRSRFRTLMGHFATGVTVVTTVEDGIYYGMTVNAFCSVSLDPCLVLISLRDTSTTCTAIRRSGVYAVNMLTSAQQPLAERFARHDLDPGTRFASIPLDTRLTGAPLFTEALAYLECRVVAEYPGGDHTLLVGEVLGLDYRTDANMAGDVSSPLLFFRSAYTALAEPSPLPQVSAVAAVSSASMHWTRGIGRLWNGLSRWVQARGRLTSSTCSRRCGNGSHRSGGVTYAPA
jgi:flavin reductase (DIM6/NTAB) family NADH-FMN oxidoreductase RutF